MPKNLLQLINNILDFPALFSGRMTLYMESYNLREIVDDVLPTMECLSREKNLALTADILEAIQLSANKAKLKLKLKLKQILINLIGNAIKFTHQGGISVAAIMLMDPNRIILSVKDTGIGIREEDIALVTLPIKSAVEQNFLPVWLVS